MTPERATGSRCGAMVSGTLVSYPCTLPLGHTERNEPHYAVEVERSIRTWRAWNTAQTLRAEHDLTAGTSRPAPEPAPEPATTVPPRQPALRTYARHADCSGSWTGPHTVDGNRLLICDVCHKHQDWHSDHYGYPMVSAALIGADPEPAVPMPDGTFTVPAGPQRPTEPTRQMNTPLLHALLDLRLAASRAMDRVQLGEPIGPEVVLAWTRVIACQQRLPEPRET